MNKTDPSTIIFWVSPSAFSILTNEQYGSLEKCFRRTVQTLFDYKQHFNTNYTNNFLESDILLNTLAHLPSNSSEISLSVPFGTTTCVLAHTIPDRIVRTGFAKSISFFSIDIFAALFPLLVIFCWIFTGKSKNFIYHSIETIWLSVLLIFNQINVKPSSRKLRMKLSQHGAITFMVIVFSISLIKIFFSVHFSTKLTVAKRYPRIRSLDQLSWWDVKAFVAKTGICPSVLANLPIYEDYLNKRGDETVLRMMGESASGRVIFLASINEISQLKTKLCYYYPKKRLHVSKPYAHTTVSLPFLVMNISPRKKSFINKYFSRIMEMGLDDILWRCDIENDNNPSAGDWSCSYQDNGRLSESKPIPLTFISTYTIFMVTSYFVLLVMVFAGPLIKFTIFQLKKTFEL